MHNLKVASISTAFATFSVKSQSDCAAKFIQKSRSCDVSRELHKLHLVRTIFKSRNNRICKWILMAFFTCEWSSNIDESMIKCNKSDHDVCSLQQLHISTNIQLALLISFDDDVANSWNRKIISFVQICYRNFKVHRKSIVQIPPHAINRLECMHLRCWWRINASDPVHP